MKNSLLLLLLGFFIFNSCKKDDSEGGVNIGGKKSIVPIADGNIWNYRETSNQSTSYPSSWISGDTIIASVKWFRLFNDSSYYTCVMYKEDGVHELHPGQDIDDLDFKYPAVEGDQYNLNTFPATILVQNLDTPISVPAGQFSCYEYKFIGDSTSYTLMYLSPGTGIIKALNYSQGSILYTRELMSYHLR